MYYMERRKTIKATVYRSIDEMKDFIEAETKWKVGEIAIKDSETIFHLYDAIEVPGFEIRIRRGDVLVIDGENLSTVGGLQFSRQYEAAQ